MMMPANYSAIAENEMTYVVGGGIADVLAPVMTAENWQNFNKNLVMLIGNSYLKNFVSSTLGVVFGSGYVFGDVTTGIFGKGGILDTAFNASAGKVNGGSGVASSLAGATSAALQIVGGLASIYALGNGTVGLYGDASKMTIWGGEV